MGGLNQMGNFRRVVAKHHGAHLVGGKHIPRADEQVFPPDFSINPGPPFIGENAVNQGKSGGQDLLKPGDHVVKVFFRVCTVAFFSRIDVNGSFEILDPQRNNRLGVGFEHGNVDHEVGFEKIHAEIEGRTVTECNLFEGPFKQVHHADAVLFFHGVIAKGLKCVGGCFPVLRV